MLNRSQLKRDDILDTASLLFAKHGFQGTSMKLLSKEAQASTSTIYTYFEDKTDLMSQSVERRLTALEQQFHQEVCDIADPVDALLRGISVLNRAIATDPLLSRLVIYESKVSDLRLKSHVQKVVRRIDAQGIKLVNRAVEAGAMTCDDPEALIIAVRLAFQGWLLSTARGEKVISENRLTRIVKLIIVGLINDN